MMAQRMLASMAMVRGMPSGLGPFSWSCFRRTERERAMVTRGQVMAERNQAAKRRQPAVSEYLQRVMIVQMVAAKAGGAQMPKTRVRRARKLRGRGVGER